MTTNGATRIVSATSPSASWRSVERPAERGEATSAGRCWWVVARPSARARALGATVSSTPPLQAPRVQARRQALRSVERGATATRHRPWLASMRTAAPSQHLRLSIARSGRAIELCGPPLGRRVARPQGARSAASESAASALGPVVFDRRVARLRSSFASRDRGFVTRHRRIA
jgi:hypothetical protein